MSEPNAPDPLDMAYVQAESLLDDAAGRTARRTRVFDAVARETSAPNAVASPAPRRTARRGGAPQWAGWLAAAGVAGVSLILVSQTYQPVARASWRPVARPAALTPRVRSTGAGLTAAEVAPSKPVVQRSAAAPRRATPPVLFNEANRPRSYEPAPATPAGRAFPVSAKPTPPTAGWSASAFVAPNIPASPPLLIKPVEAPRPISPAPPVVAAPARPPPRPPERPNAASLFGQTSALGDAAAAGRTSEVEALLAQGAFADAADANGDTPLIKAVRSDHPASASVLRRYGASLDRRNDAGESARDLAAAKEDPALDRALGLVPSSAP